MQALVVVAQRELSDLLVKALHKIDFEALQVGDASAAANAYQSQLPALVITSWGLGDLDGLAFCRELRQINPRHNPLVLIVSDRTSQADLQTILEAGADDYLLYPMESDRFRIRLQIAAQAREIGQPLQLSNVDCEKASNVLSSRSVGPMKVFGMLNRLDGLGMSPML